MKLFKKLIRLALMVLIIAFLIWMASHNQMPLLEAIKTGFFFLLKLAFGMLSLLAIVGIGFLIARWIKKRSQDNALEREGNARAAVWERNVPYAPYKKWWQFWKH